MVFKMSTLFTCVISAGLLGLSLADQICGQTDCKEPGYCCSDTEESKVKDCCCNSIGGHSINCVRHTELSVPWWAAIFVVIAIVAIVSTVVFVCYRKRKNQLFNRM